MKKKICIALAMIISGMSLLAGCGEGSAGKDGDSSAAEVTEAPAESPAESAETGDSSESQAPEGDSTGGGETTDSEVPEIQVLDLGDTIYKGIIKDGGFVIESCETREEELVVPDTLFDVPVVKIANSCFSLQGTRSVTLPDTVESIALNAFCWGSALETVDLGDGLVTVGAEIFYDCPLITEIRFPEGMTTIGGCLCIECPALEKLYIPASVTTIDLFEDEFLVDTATCPNVTVVTPEGSAAETAAIAAGIPVEHP